MITLPLSEGEHVSFYGLYIVVSRNHSLQNPPGGEVYSQLKVYNVSTFKVDLQDSRHEIIELNLGHLKFHQNSPSNSLKHG